MKKSIYVMGVILWILLLIFVIVQTFYGQFYLLSNTSELRNHVEIPSPNKNIIVEVFDIYGGATSTDFTQVHIRYRNEPFDSEHNFCLLSVEGVKKVKITWVSDAELKIECQPSMVYRKAPGWNGISMMYSELK